MKYLFLDFDGVLNSAPFLEDAHARRRSIERDGGSIGDDSYMLDWYAVARVNRIVEATGAKVVISSSWRILDSMKDIVGFLDNVGFAGHVVGMTPNLQTYRGLEIQAWIDALEEPPESIVILDDDSDMEHLTDRLVNTDFETGIVDADVERTIALLNTPWVDARKKVA